MSTSRRPIAGHLRRPAAAASGLRVPQATPRYRRRRRAARSGARPRRDWSQTLTSLIALGALVFTGVSVMQTGRQNAQQDDLTAQGQITDRYTAAVTQLGSSNSVVCLGGIYALERIMRDSPADQPTIVEVLSAFIRGHAPGTTKPASQPLPTDVAAALSVLGRRTTAHDGGSVEDLRRVNFADIDLSGTTLAGADLGGADLARANLTGANLTGAYLGGAKLTGASLADADLTNAHTNDVHLTNAHTDDVHLLTYVDLAGAYLTHANLTGASLALADLRGAKLTGADLADADLNSANLTGAFLLGANLTGANLTGAGLTGALAYGTSLCSGSIPAHPQLGYGCDWP